MQIECIHCGLAIEYSGERPSFCGFCGRPLAAGDSDATVASVPAGDPDVTVASVPAGDPDVTVASDPVVDPDRTIDLSSPSGEPIRPAPPVQTIGPYRLVRELGRGGMGTVLEAVDMSGPGERRVALKLISRDLVSSREAVDRFRREGRVASQLSHPRCVFVLAADEHSAQPYIVMELMPGSTLGDLVEQEGPLEAGQAVSRILDVIEGLEEAHKLGVLHRDVKPSNCFLDDDGRVKIGDFGLSKSLVSDASLTMSGTFLGTPLYASPEQIRGDTVDARSDLYSVAATLYFLLAGAAPFQGGDGAQVVARIVSEPAPSLRSKRPEVPPALDRVVLRGLERDPARRWESLASFREALLSFAEHESKDAARELRFVAYVVDYMALLLTFFVLNVLVGISRSLFVWVSLHAAYFGLFEGATGSASLGKRLLRLRVSAAVRTGSVSLPRYLLRYVVFDVLVGVTRYVQFFLPDLKGYILLPISAGGLLLLWSTARRRTGYRGLHDVLSGTRVIHRPRHASKPLESPARRSDRLEPVPAGTPERFGSFRTRGLLHQNAERTLLVAEDSTLGRTVWILRGPSKTSLLSESRRTVDRSTRLRWLTSGRDGDLQWEALVAPAGTLLRDLVRRDNGWPAGLSWREMRRLLEDLSGELAAVLEDGTLPDSLSVNHVWVEPDGKLKLLDASPDPAGLERPPDGENDIERRCLELLKDTAVLGLEGRPRQPHDRHPFARAPVPLHAQRILEPLLGAGDPLASVEDLHKQLIASQDRPCEFTRTIRGAQVLLQLLLLVLLAMVLAPLLGIADRTAGGLGWYAPPLLAVLWAGLTGGGLSLRFMGMRLARTQGGPATKLQSFWRATIVWTPIVLIMLGTHWLDRLHPQQDINDYLPFALLAVLVLYIALTLIWPTRSVHDRLAGTVVVPA